MRRGSSMHNRLHSSTASGSNFCSRKFGHRWQCNTQRYRDKDRDRYSYAWKEWDKNEPCRGSGTAVQYYLEEKDV